MIHCWAGLQDQFVFGKNKPNQQQLKFQDLSMKEKRKKRKKRKEGGGGGRNNNKGKKMHKYRQQ